MSVKLLKKPEMLKWSWKKVGIMWVVFVVIFAGLSSLYEGKSILEVIEILGFQHVFLYPIPIALLVVSGELVGNKIAYDNLMSQLEVEAIDKKAENLQEDLDKDFFNNLVKINFKYLDKYYLQTQVQADKSFLHCLFAAIVGLAIIAVGIAMMYFGKTEPAYVTTAAGVISEFIAAVFFYLYNKTILSMADYHKKLVITQNISLALKITNELPTDVRAQSQSAIVTALTNDVNHLLAGIGNNQSDKASIPVSKS